MRGGEKRRSKLPKKEDQTYCKTTHMRRNTASNLRFVLVVCAKYTSCNKATFSLSCSHLRRFTSRKTTVKKTRFIVKRRICVAIRRRIYVLFWSCTSSTLPEAKPHSPCLARIFAVLLRVKQPSRRPRFHFARRKCLKNPAKNSTSYYSKTE